MPKFEVQNKARLWGMNWNVKRACLDFFFSPGISIYQTPAKIMIPAVLWDSHTVMSCFGVWKAIVSTQIFKKL